MVSIAVSPDRSVYLTYFNYDKRDRVLVLTLLGLKARGFLVQSVGLPVDATTNE